MEHKCRMCGDCCKGKTLFRVFICIEDVRRWTDAGFHYPIDLIIYKDGQYMWEFVNPPQCPFLNEDMSCSIYELRPNRCRTYFCDKSAVLFPKL